MCTGNMFIFLSFWMAVNRSLFFLVIILMAQMLMVLMMVDLKVVLTVVGVGEALDDRCSHATGEEK